MRPRSREEFEIALICALPREADAVRALFDVTFDDAKSYGKERGDPNSYTTGKMGQHYVVLAHMPEMGKGRAAAVASSLRMSYVGIQLVLLVGICGGVPSFKKADIILGDVVISNGVLRYDFGRQYPDGFARKGARDTLCHPTAEIRSVLANLETEESRRKLDAQLASYLEHIQRNLAKARYPGSSEDRLFEASYRHKHYQPDAAPCICAQSNESRDPVCADALTEDCSVLGCNGRLVQRARLNSTNPKPAVHIGLVASGDTVMRSGVDRDEIAQDGVIAFEMEGAGVWDTLPCVIIKGVCDYADSHKGKAWQDYAAATSAAGAKAFLQFWTSSSPKRHWIVPFQRNEIFVGRDSELEQLERGLFKDGHFAKMAIYALGGMGKSALALELVYRIHAKHSEYSVLWVNASTVETLEQSYRQIGLALGLPVENSDFMAVVKRYLSETAGRWLMIMDNADDIAAWYDAPRGKRLADHVPVSTTGCVLLTTRTRKIATKFAPRGMVSLKEMDFDGCSRLLSNSLVYKSLLDDAERTSQLLERLCYLPLAVVQAAAYINENDIDFEDYLKLLTDTEETLVETLLEDFEDDGRYPDQQNPVLTTWLISFEHIQKRSPTAAEYLRFLACVDSKAVPRSILPSHSSKQEMEAIGTLTAFAFLHKRMDEAFDMHRLVHLATRNWLSVNNQLEDALGKATYRLTSVFPAPDHEHRSVWRKLLPHVGFALKLTSGWTAALDELFSLYGACLFQEGRYNEAEWPIEVCVQGLTRTSGSEDPKTLRSMARLASVYRDQGRWDEAERLFVQVMDTRMLVLGAEHKDSLTSMSNLASTFWNLGRLDEAQKLYEQVLDKRKRVLGADHIQTIESMASLAETYSHQGRQQEAEKLEMEVLNMRKRVLGPEHPDTLTTMSNLASTYVRQGRWQEAEKLFLQVTDTRLRVLGADHPDTLISMGNLASAYSGQGRWQEAEKLETKVMEKRKRVLGAEHPQTLISIGNLATTYCEQDRLNEAEKLETDLLETRKRVLGPEHPQTLASLSNLASVYKDQERWQEAEKLGLEVIRLRKRIIGAEHQDTLASMNNLATTYVGQGRLDEAEKLEAEVMETRQRVLGAEHPETLASRGNLALIYNKQGHLEKASKLEGEVLEAKKRVLGIEHPHTLSSLTNLAWMYRSQGRLVEAEELCLEVIATRTRTLGPEHPKTLSAMSSLSMGCGQAGQWAAAEHLSAQVADARKRVLGVEHPDTLDSMSNLAIARGRQGRWDEAEKLLEEVMDTQYRVLGLESPQTLSALYNLAYAHKFQGHDDEALRLMSFCCDKRHQTLGAGHPDAKEALQIVSSWQ